MVATRARGGYALDIEPIEPLLVRIVAELAPVEVRLFGSRARGDGTADSDWEVVPDDLPAADDLFAGYRLKRETRTRADVILSPVTEFLEDRDTPNTLAYEAAHCSVTIYRASDQ